MDHQAFMRVPPVRLIASGGHGRRTRRGCAAHRSGLSWISNSPGRLHSKSRGRRTGSTALVGLPNFFFRPGRLGIRSAQSQLGKIWVADRRRRLCIVSRDPLWSGDFIAAPQSVASPAGISPDPHGQASGIAVNASAERPGWQSSREHCFTQYLRLLDGSPQMRDIRRIVEDVADTDATVLIRGESGVGKDVVARAIHTASTRCAGPFVRINCAAIPSGLLESELFGHEKGAFTGAHRPKVGLFQNANHGTIYLDEIGELRAPPQA